MHLLSLARWLLAGLVLCVGLEYAQQSPPQALAASSRPLLASEAAPTWRSGASGDGAADGSFGEWRGDPIGIGGTWNDSYDAQTQLWTLWQGEEWGAWQGDLDIAIGAIYTDRGESWGKAAAGAYDSRWRASLTKLKSLWGTRPGTVHLRFAHEFNGDWVPWRVKNTDAADFVEAWRRFRSLQTSIFPTAKLVFCPNDGSSASLRLDWRKAFPGSSFVDEMAVDSYNASPFVDTPEEFAAKINKLDRFGAPLGIEAHRRYAASVGKPFAVAEWGTSASLGDGSVYVEQMASWLRANAGTGPGEVVYDVYFNVSSAFRGVYGLYPTTRQPAAAAAYAAAF